MVSGAGRCGISFWIGADRTNWKTGSEYGGYRWLETHSLTGEPFWLDCSDEVFSVELHLLIMDIFMIWITNGTILFGSFRIKMLLELIDQNVDEQNYEFDFRKRVQDKILRYILWDYREKNPEFAEFLDKEGYCVEDILENISEDGLLSVMEFYHKYRKIFDYFDDWILIKTNEEDTEITDIVVKKMSENHVEACEW